MKRHIKEKNKKGLSTIARRKLQRLSNVVWKGKKPKLPKLIKLRGRKLASQIVHDNRD